MINIFLLLFNHTNINPSRPRPRPSLFSFFFLPSMDLNQTRLIGDYILGPIIGRGSFAVVRRAKHRCSCLEVAVKEIDKKLLSPKVSDNLLKEISILSTINHPNIIRLFESIEVNSTLLPLARACACYFLIWSCCNLIFL